MSTSVIVLDDVSKRYPLYDNPWQRMLGHLGLGTRSVRHKLALDGASLRIDHGERIGIVGHNGSGKTTLLRIVSGYTRASTGRVRIDGPVQALMQTGYGFNEDLSGLENIRNALVYNGLTGDECARAEAEIVQFVELGEFLRHPIRTYSLGMRTRLEFAAATAIRPNVLVIDEVLGAGDGYFARKCAARMRQLVSSTTLLLVSHSLGQIREYCKRVIWLDGGRIREDGTVEAVLGRYREHMMRRAARSNPVADPAESGAADRRTSLLHARASALFGITAADREFVLSFGFDDTRDGSRAMETGDALTLRLSLQLDRALTPVVLGLSLQGALVFELDTGSAVAAGRHDLRLHIPRCGIGVGRFLLAPALREPGSDRLVALDRSLLELHMNPTNWSNPPMVHLDGQWTTGVAHAPLRSKVSAWV